MKTVAEAKCEAKTRFASQALANANAEIVRKRRGLKAMRSYKCPHCSFWHITKAAGASNMRGLSLWEPWATLVALGMKKIETRSWETNYRGPIAICASKRFPREAQALCSTEPFKSALAYTTLSPGCVVAVVELTDCRQMRGIDWTDELSFIERAFGHYEPGRFGWTLESATRLKHPLPFSGAQGLFKIQPGVEVQIYGELQ